jgi:hypothetical protein
MINLDLIQVIVQGGAVGLLLAFGYFGYRLANRLMTFGFTLVTNHLAHLEQAFLKVEKTLTRLDETIDRLARKK